MAGIKIVDPSEIKNEKTGRGVWGEIAKMQVGQCAIVDATKGNLTLGVTALRAFGFNFRLVSQGSKSTAIIRES